MVSQHLTNISFQKIRTEKIDLSKTYIGADRNVNSGAFNVDAIRNIAEPRQYPASLSK
jgi:hypothetical protein